MPDPNRPSVFLRDSGEANRTRRRFVAGTLRLPLAAFIASATPWPALGAEHAAGVSLDSSEVHALERVFYLLFPFPELGPAPYRDAVAALDARIAAEPALGTLVRGGQIELSAAAAGDWIGLAEGQQIAALGRIERSPFFQRMLGHVQATLFNDPRLWKLIGYEGSSLEFGGYAGRGLDDIDWLDDGKE